MLKKLSLLILSITLMGCGFHLRGSLTIPSYLRTVYIAPYEPYEPLQSMLRMRLKNNNVKILTNPNAKVTTLEISKPSSGQQILAYGSSGEVQRYKLSVTVAYTLNIPGKSQKIQRTIIRSRELNRSNNMLLSNEGEEQLVKKELLGELVSEMLRQITTVTTDDNPC
jgi:LPS-assembly lipoprotein